MRFKQLMLAGSLVLAFAASVGVTKLIASSHREAPGITKDPTADNTDVYAFVSPDQPSTVTLISNWLPFVEPSGGPNFSAFDDDAWYYIIVDNKGDAKDHIVYEFKFRTEIRDPNTFLYNTGAITSLDDRDFNVRQFYTVTRYDDGDARVLGRNLPVPPSRVGDISTPDYAELARQAVKTLSDGSKVFAGERDDPFFVDLGATFDFLSIRRGVGNEGFGVDGLGGFNVLTIALQIPKERLTRDGRAVSERNAIIGVYSTTERRASLDLSARNRSEDNDDDDSDDTDGRGRGRGRGRGGDPRDPRRGHDGDGDRTSDRVQVSRLGSPLVNEVVIPLKDKDRWNASSPRRDGQFLRYVTNPLLATLLNARYGISIPGTPRNDLVAVFLTGVTGLTKPVDVRPAEFLRLNMSIPPASSPNRLGVLAGDLAGFPNGRRLADDIVDIEERAVAGVLVPGFNIAPNNQLGDGVDVNDLPFLSVFPYMATSHNGLDHEHHRREPVHGPLSSAAGDNGVESTQASTDLEPAEEPGVRMSGPNPSSQPRLAYTVNRSARITLKVFDVQGREVRALVDRDAAPGTFDASWDGRAEDGSLAGKGVFFARFTMDGTVVNIKKLVVR